MRQGRLVAVDALSSCSHSSLSHSQCHPYSLLFPSLTPFFLPAPSARRGRTRAPSVGCSVVTRHGRHAAPHDRRGSKGQRRRADVLLADEKQDDDTEDRRKDAREQRTRLCRHTSSNVRLVYRRHIGGGDGARFAQKRASGACGSASEEGGSSDHSHAPLSDPTANGSGVTPTVRGTGCSASGSLTRASALPCLCRSKICPHSRFFGSSPNHPPPCAPSSTPSVVCPARRCRWCSSRLAVSCISMRR